MTATAQPRISTSYSLDTLKDEARQLVETGIISRQQSIYSLCNYIPAREWVTVECQLERYDYLLRDPIGDLISYERWESD
ncbi:MAG: DUF4327 family protein [Cyanobacteria bacterium J06635_13]